MALGLSLAVAGLGPGAAACETGRGEPSFEEVHAGIARRDNPDPTDGELDEMHRGGNGFGIKLFHELRAKESGNFAISPRSIRSAFALLYAAARGETEAELADALGFLGDPARTHNAMNYYGLELGSRNHSAHDPADDVILVETNQMFARPDLVPGDMYLETLAKDYGAGVFLVDFASEPEQARTRINDWAAFHTRERIPEIFPPGSISAQTLWVLANALFLKAAWSHKFDVQATEDRPFTRLDGTTVDRPTMHSGDIYGWYGSGSNYEIAELPLFGKDLSMVVILPNEGAYAEVEASLDAGALETMLFDLPEGKMTTALPKFTVEVGPILLNDSLQALGISKAFGAADFSGFGGDGRLNSPLAFVYHRVFVAVDESGIEAAAVTGLPSQESGPMFSIAVDRPFLFLIRDRPTGLILFLGRVLDPA